MKTLSQSILGDLIIDVVFTLAPVPLKASTWRALYKSLISVIQFLLIQVDEEKDLCNPFFTLIFLLIRYVTHKTGQLNQFAI